MKKNILNDNSVCSTDDEDTYDDDIRLNLVTEWDFDSGVGVYIHIMDAMTIIN